MVLRPPLRFAAASVLGLRFRPIGESDLPFLERLYASTRAEELAAVPWPPEAKQAFLAQQFRAQHAHYQLHYTDTDWLVILSAGEAIGRLYIARWPHEHRVVDIAFLPEHRGQGLGGALMRDLVEEAGAAGKPLTIHVEKNNPARRLYARLGFRPIGESGVYDLMEWRADPRQVKTA